MSISPSFTGGWNSLPPGDGWQRQDEILVFPPRGSVFPLMGFYFFNLQTLTKWTPPKDRRKREEKVKHTTNTRYTHIPNICTYLIDRFRGKEGPREAELDGQSARRRLGASGRPVCSPNADDDKNAELTIENQVARPLDNQIQFFFFLHRGDDFGSNGIALGWLA